MASWWNDLKNSVVSGLSLRPATRTASAVTAAAAPSDDSVYADMKEAETGLFALILLGDIGGQPNSWTFDLYESDIGGTDTGTAIVNADALVIDGAGFDNSVAVLNFKRSKRYVRARATLDGTSTAYFSVSIHGLRKAGPYVS